MGKTKKKKRLLLSVDYFDEGRLVVAGGLKAMEIHDGRSNISEAARGYVIAESDSRVKAWTSYGNWHLQEIYR